MCIRDSPAPFPVQLPERCIRLFSYKDDTVLDPFLGSGTTLIAALQNDRKGIGIDIDKHYCEIAIERLKKEVDFEMITLKEFSKTSRNKPNTQINAIMQFFKDNPNRDITYAEVKKWINNEYKVKTGTGINYFERKIRNLFEQGKLVYVQKGVHRYDKSEKK